MGKLYFLLGAPDPEMEVIKGLLNTLGVEWAHATSEGRVVHPGSAYKADGTTRPIGVRARVVVVECAVEGIEPSVVVDHHRPGDPGFGLPPEEFWRASSVGQVYEFLVNGEVPGGGRKTPPLGEPQEVAGRVRHLLDDARLAAAADHCLGHAYQGRCPGVDPADLRVWRARTRAKHQGVDPEEILQRVDRAVEALHALPTVEVGGQSFKDARGMEIPELPEASAIAGAVWYSLFDSRSNRLKEGVLGGTPAEVKAWMEHAKTRLEGVYGDPARGFAGGYRPAG